MLLIFMYVAKSAGLVMTRSVTRWYPVRNSCCKALQRHCVPSRVALSANYVATDSFSVSWRWAIIRVLAELSLCASCLVRRIFTGDSWYKQ